MDAVTIKAVSRWRQPFSWLVFVLYVLVLGLSISHHELWGDEIHSWNISKASSSYATLLSNIRYEGHPPFWYTLMWTLSRFTHELVYLQLLQYGIACLFVFVFVFYTPFSRIIRLLVPFGYYFLFEYGTLSRNYAGALLLAFLICVLLTDKGKRPVLSYYVLLFLLSNTHLLAAVLAAAIHVYFVLQLKDRGYKKTTQVLHLLAGALLILPSLYFIFPPSDSEMNLQFWVDHWNKQQVADIFEAPVKSFIAIPSGWQYHWWNTEIFISLKARSSLFTIPVYALSVCIVGLVIWILKKDRKALTLFLFNLGLTFLVAAIFPLNSARYVGFIYISFLIALWLYASARPLQRWQQNVVMFILIIQIIGARVAVGKDYGRPFSNAGKANEMIDRIPANDLVTDYWCLNNLAAFADKPFYCIELNRELNYLLWDQKMAVAMKAKTPYCNGFSKYFSGTGKKAVYLLSSNEPEKLRQMEPDFLKNYTVVLLRSKTDAIERYSNLYLYRVSKKTETQAAQNIP